MLENVANYKKPLVWIPFVMPSTDKIPVEEVSNSFGEETVLYRVGQKMMCVTMGEDWPRDDTFITTIDNAYVKDLEKRHGYWYPSSFETDENGQYVKVSLEDEKALIDFLAKQDAASVETGRQQGKKATTHQIKGTYFSAENGIVYKNPAHPNKPPEQRRDKRFDH